MFFDCLWNTLDNILTYVLTGKIYIQDTQYYKSLEKKYIEYTKPKDDILEVKLFDENKCIDITNEFITHIQKKDLTWDDILKTYGHLIDNTNNENFHLDIRYNLDNDKYRIIYKFNHGKEINFPPYSQEELEKYKQLKEKNEVYKRKVLFAELQQKDGKTRDITNLIKEYSGPLENFYIDKEHEIHASLIKDENGGRILLENENICITDTLADDITFESNDILKLD